MCVDNTRASGVCHAEPPQHKGEKEDYRMKSIAVASLFVLAATAAQAEIMCTETGGCWETGKQIRLVHSRQETNVPSRDGKGRTRIIGIANDMPHQNFSQPQRQKGR